MRNLERRYSAGTVRGIIARNGRASLVRLLLIRIELMKDRVNVGQ